MWPNLQETADFVTFTEEILNGKLHFLCIAWTYVINDLNGEEIVGTIYENKLQKTDKKKFRIAKVI